MKSFAAGLFLSLATLTSWATPPEMTSEQLNSICGKGDSQSDETCQAFISNIYAAALDSGVACDPAGAGAADVRRYILLYIRENPQDGNAPAVEVALDALRQAFPCR